MPLGSAFLATAGSLNALDRQFLIMHTGLCRDSLLRDVVPLGVQQ